MFLAGADKNIKVWDVDSGRHIRMFEGHEEEIYSVVADSFSNVPSLLPITTGIAASELSDHPTLSSNRTITIVSASRDLSIRIWDFRTGFLLYALTGHTRCIYGVNVFRVPGNAPDKIAKVAARGTPLAVSCSDDGTIRVWNLGTGKLVKSFKWHRVNIRSIDTAVFKVPDETSGKPFQYSFPCLKIHPCLSILGNHGTGKYYDAPLIASLGWDKSLQVHNLLDACFGNEGGICQIS